MTSVTFSFNGAGAILAVMAVDWSGEPAVCSYEVLWSVDAKTGHVRQVNEWNANLLGAGWREADHRLGAWSSDGKSIQIIADSYYLTDGAADMEYRGLVGLWVNMTHRPAKKPAKK